MSKNLTTATLKRSEGTLREKDRDVELTGSFCKLPSETLLWEYECCQCKTTFEKPPPRGPKEERETRCPGCGSMDLKRLNTGGLAETPCGG